MYMIYNIYNWLYLLEFGFGVWQMIGNIKTNIFDICYITPGLKSRNNSKFKMIDNTYMVYNIQIKPELYNINNKFDARISIYITYIIFVRNVSTHIIKDMLYNKNNIYLIYSSYYILNLNKHYYIM